MLEISDWRDSSTLTSLSLKNIPREDEMSVLLIRKSWATYDAGAAKEKEDGYVTYGPLSAVIDASSEPWAQKYPKTLLNGSSLGEHTARFAESFLGPRLYLLRDEPISTLFSELNQAALLEKISNGIPKEIAELSGASFAAANVKYDNTEILAAGDSFVAGELKNGKIFITENQVHLHDTAMHKEIARLMKEVAAEWKLRLDSVDEQTLDNIREETWNRFVPILKVARKRVMNNPEVPEGYPTLNGDSRSESMWQRFLLPTADLKRLLLFTDGIVAWEILERLTSKQLGIFIMEFYKKTGIDGLLDLTRSMETATSQRSYTPHAEATIIAIELS